MNLTRSCRKRQWHGALASIFVIQCCQVRNVKENVVRSLANYKNISFWILSSDRTSRWNVMFLWCIINMSFDLITRLIIPKYELYHRHCTVRITQYGNIGCSIRWVSTFRLLSDKLDILFCEFNLWKNFFLVQIGESFFVEMTYRFDYVDMCRLPY